VAWATPDLSLDVGFLGPEGGDVPPGFEGVLLSRSRFVGGHPSYGRLAVRQDGHQSERVVPSCCEGRALGVVGFLAPAHVILVALPRLALLPGDCVAGCSVLQSGPVVKMVSPGQSVRFASFARLLLPLLPRRWWLPLAGRLPRGGLILPCRSSIRGGI